MPERYTGCKGCYSLRRLITAGTAAKVHCCTARQRTCVRVCLASATNGATADAAHAATSLLGGSNISHFAASGNGIHGDSTADGSGGGVLSGSGSGGGGSGGGSGGGGGRGGGGPGSGSEGGDRRPRNLRLALDSLVGAAVLAALLTLLVHYMGKLRRGLAAFLHRQRGDGQPGSRTAQREHLAELRESQATIRCALCFAALPGVPPCRLSCVLAFLGLLESTRRKAVLLFVTLMHVSPSHMVNIACLSEMHGHLSCVTQ